MTVEKETINLITHLKTGIANLDELQLMHLQKMLEAELTRVAIALAERRAVRNGASHTF